jgi:hypothetical protein
MLKKPLMLGIILLTTTAATCVPSTTEIVRPIDNFCLVAKPITFSRIRPEQVETKENKYDTEETVDQVEEHDIVYERLCRPKTENRNSEK